MLAKLVQRDVSNLCRLVVATSICKPLRKGTFSHFCSRSTTDQPESSERNIQAAATPLDEPLNTNTPAEAFASSDETRERMDQDDSQGDASDEDYMKPQPRKERIKKCLEKLKKGPDGRFINVLEVASDVNMLIAAYQSLKAQSRPTYLIENSDDEDSMEGIDIERFKKLQKRLRSGTYRFGTVKEPDEK